VGGQHKIRLLWRKHYENTDALIFVVDSTNEDRMEEAAEEIKKMLCEEELQKYSLLVLANKQDLLGALAPSEVAIKLKLETVKINWVVQGTSANTGQGIKPGLDWLALEMQMRKD